MTNKVSSSRSCSGRTRRLKPLESDLIKPGEDWRNVPDSAERRRIQNRIAQRSYRRGMRARKNEIEELKKQLQQYMGARSDSQSISPPPHSGQKHATVDAIDKAQPTSSPQDSLRNSIENTQDMAVLSINGQGTGSVFATPPHSQLGTNDSVGQSPYCGPSDTHSQTLPIIYGDPSTMQPQSTTLGKRNDMTAQNTGSDQPWDPAVWSWPPPGPDLPKEQPREPIIPSTTGRVSLTPVPRQPGSGASILHLSILSGNCDILNMLLQDCEVNIDEKDNAGFTPLQRAVLAGRADMVAVLLDNGAEINEQD